MTLRAHPCVISDSLLRTHSGNYGVPSDERDEYGLHRYFESDRVQVAALIVADYSFDHSHHAAAKSLSQVRRVSTATSRTCKC
jgi:hypothetical protein